MQVSRLCWYVFEKGLTSHQRRSGHLGVIVGKLYDRTSRSQHFYLGWRIALSGIIDHCMPGILYLCRFFADKELSHFRMTPIATDQHVANLPCAILKFSDDVLVLYRNRLQLLIELCTLVSLIVMTVVGCAVL